MRFSLIVLALIGICLAQVDRDWSLNELCKYYNGQFTQRSSKNEIAVGDKCENLKIQYAVETDTMAWRLCEEMFPYHVTKATRDTTQMLTVCEVEAGLICKKDWIQLYGRCYKMEKKLMKYQDAKDHCQSWDGATIGFIHRNILPVHWKDYYTGVSKMWVQASEVIHDDLKYNAGDHMMLVLNGWHYGVKSFSLIRVDGNVDKAMVLCEYTPQMTREESTYLLRRYSEIYHPGFTTINGMFIRTASATLGSELEMNENSYCERMMKPFMMTSTVGKKNKAHGAQPDKLFLAALSTSNRQESSFYRTNIFFRAQPYERNTVDCFPEDNLPIKDHELTDYIPGHPVAKCDMSGWGVGMMSVGKKDVKLQSQPVTRAAPMFCQVRFDKIIYGDCKEGYSAYMRSNGVKWCHKFVYQKQTADLAQDACRIQDETALSGFEDEEELKFMWNLLLADPSTQAETSLRGYIGAKRRFACRWGQSQQGTGGWRDDASGECSRKNVFQWSNNVAINPPNFENVWARAYEPNYSNNWENCLEVQMKSGDRNTGLLNDMPCTTHPNSFWCGVEAAQIYKDFNN